MVLRSEIESHLKTFLSVDQFHDYGPNGLQIEGRLQVKNVVSGVTASLALIEAAIAQGADTILVHHGLFWKGHNGCLTGWLKARVAALLRHDVSLLAYHLPLDAHPVVGNNAQLGKLLGVVPETRFGEQQLGVMGTALNPFTTETLQALLTQKLGRTPLWVQSSAHVARPLKRIAWCSGGAQSYFETAIAAGADVFITGEISEPQTHLARETGVVFVACGHHATERYGVQALGQHLAEQFGLVHTFIDIDNPA
jgi:dinuclear metal center YbgI/SA1388 family protein